MDNIHHERESRLGEGVNPPVRPERVSGAASDASDERFLDGLEQFVCEGLRANEGVVVIATMAHLFELERRLGRHEFQFPTMQARGQYVRMNAHEALWQFMVAGRPDPAKFQAFVDKLLAEAARGGRRVRAHCEMVDLLLALRRTEAAGEVELLWAQACTRLACRVHGASAAPPTHGIASVQTGPLGRMQQA